MGHLNTLYYESFNSFKKDKESMFPAADPSEKKTFKSHNIIVFYEIIKIHHVLYKI